MISTYTSEWKNRTKAQLLDDLYALMENRDQQIARAERAEDEVLRLRDGIAELVEHYSLMESRVHNTPDQYGQGRRDVYDDVEHTLAALLNPACTRCRPDVADVMLDGALVTAGRGVALDEPTFEPTARRFEAAYPFTCDCGVNVRAGSMISRTDGEYVCSRCAA